MMITGKFAWSYIQRTQIIRTSQISAVDRNSNWLANHGLFLIKVCLEEEYSFLELICKLDISTNIYLKNM